MTQVKKCFLLFLLLPFCLNAQTVQINKESTRIEGKNRPGYKVDFTADEEAVRTSLSRYLKTIGKTRTSGDYMLVSEPVVNGQAVGNVIYATIKQNGSTTAAWIGMENPEDADFDTMLEKLAYDFGVSFHREQIQTQIDESIRALETVERQQSRLISQNRDLGNKVENNKREKIQLEQSLVKNRMELEELLKKIEANGKARDSIAVATEQIRKVVEIHKARQRNVQ